MFEVGKLYYREEDGWVYSCLHIGKYYVLADVGGSSYWGRALSIEDLNTKFNNDGFTRITSRTDLIAHIRDNYPEQL